MFPKIIPSFFKKQKSRNSLNKDIFHKLELLKLEERITPVVNLSPFIQLPEHNLVIITQDLLNKVPQQELANATVVTLDLSQDVISQISNQLANRNGLDTVRIISHGKDGELLFGNQVVDQSVLLSRGGEIASWGKALSPDADILLYGCSVAVSESGKNFVTTLAGLTGADVAASTNPTGASADTNLEYNAGLVTAGLQASKEAWDKSNIQLDQQDGALYFTDDGTSVTITGYNGPGGVVNIPAVLNNLPVTTIGVNAFINKVSITSINIPNSVTTIGNNAFEGCNGLTSITLPNSLITIGDSAFAGCSGFTSITIPPSVTIIGDQAFQSCSGLTSINIPASVIGIGHAAFMNCSGLINVIFDSDSSLIYIKNQAFDYCTKLVTITIPSSVTIIMDQAFQGCSNLNAINVDTANPNYSSYFGVLYNKNQTALITVPSGISTIIFPNTITDIGSSSFFGCDLLTSVTISASIINISPNAFHKHPFFNVDPANLNFSSDDGVLYNKDKSILYLCPENKTGFFTIPNTVIYVGSGAFNACVNLLSITIPNSTIIIGRFSFAGCLGLTSITIPASVTRIEDGAFIFCRNLVNVTFEPNSSLTLIDTQVFADCINLISINIPAFVASIGDTAFSGCNSLTAINVDVANLNYSSYFGVLYNKSQTSLINAPSQISIVIIPNTIVVISEYAFQGCNAITSITIPSSVTTIGNYTFRGMGNLTAIIVDVANPNFSSNDGVLYNKDQSNLINFPSRKSGSFTIPASVITISNRAFTGCLDLTGVLIPSSVLVIGDNAFANNTNLTAVTFAANSSLITIGNWAFSDCPNLTSISIPESITVIGDYAFAYCRSLVTISFQGNAPSISLNTFISAGAIRTIYYIATSSGWSNLFGGIPTICATSTNKLGVINNSLGAGDSSSITLFDPSTGLPIGVVVPFPGYIGEIRITSGDVDGDSVLDLIAGAGPGGGPAVVVINSVTGVVSQSFFAFDPNFRGGVFVAVRDINGDNILDIIVGAGAGGGPEVRIFDGRTNSILKSFFAYDVGFRGGVSVATLDFNGDGILDLVTGAGPGGAPHVKVFDGATGNIISQWYAYSLDFLGGVYVAAGDIGNDGRIEVVTGPGSGSPPLVRVWDPLTATMLAQFYAYAEEFNGGVRVGVSDGNFDGILDLITGAGEGGGPEVKGFSFPELDLLFSFFSGEETNTTGVFVS